MSIKQFNGAYLVNEDRILFRFNTQSQEEYRFWFTRRVTLFILAASSHLHSKKMEQTHSPDVVKAIGDFEKEVILETVKTENAQAQTYEAGLNFPLGFDPILVMDVTCSLTKNGEKLFQENFKNEMATLRNYKINLSRKHVLSYMGGHSSYTGFPFFGANTKDTTFYIPLSEISPFFNSQLIPYKLLSGSILRLTMADPIKSIFTYIIQPSGLLSRPEPRLSTTTATISNVALILSEKQLYPEVKEAVNKQLNSPEGLQYSYYSNHTFAYKFKPETLGPLIIGEDYTIPINLSVGKIKYIAIKPTPIDAIKADFCYPSATWEQLNSITGNPDARQNLPFKIKIRLGNDVLSTYDVETIPEMYEQTSKALANISFPDCHDVDVKRNINKKSTGVIGFNDYYQYFVLGGNNTPTRQTKGTVFAFDFERTKALGISGVSTNMERLLEIELFPLPPLPFFFMTSS
jgi:hypothetical protein